MGCNKAIRFHLCYSDANSLSTHRDSAERLNYDRNSIVDSRFISNRTPFSYERVQQKDVSRPRARRGEVLMKEYSCGPVYALLLSNHEFPIFHAASTQRSVTRLPSHCLSGKTYLLSTLISRSTSSSPSNLSRTKLSIPSMPVPPPVPSSRFTPPVPGRAPVQPLTTSAL